MVCAAEGLACWRSTDSVALLVGLWWLERGGLGNRYAREPLHTGARRALETEPGCCKCVKEGPCRCKHVKRERGQMLPLKRPCQFEASLEICRDRGQRCQCRILLLQTCQGRALLLKTCQKGALADTAPEATVSV